MKKNIIKKKYIVENIKKIFFEKPIIGIVNFSNITSLELKEIRKTLRENNIYIRVFKNTLMIKAFLNTVNFDFFKKSRAIYFAVCKDGEIQLADICLTGLHRV